SFVTELNAALVAAGKPGKITLDGARREGVTGAILGLGGTEVYMTFESLLDNVRGDMETEIAQILFNE
ncbi:MAG: V-type ATP synthase subunit E, partial [Clostridia bacterium]